MITLIGNSTTCIGFGLCGIQDIVEVDDPEAVVSAVEKSRNDVIMIDEELYRKVKGRLPKEKFYIKIPQENGFEDEIEEIVKETTG